MLERKGPEEAGRFASQVFTLLVLSQVVLLGLVYLDMPLLVELTSPGFVSQPDKFGHAVEMSRIMFPYIAFIAVFALHQGTLNAPTRSFVRLSRSTATADPVTLPSTLGGRMARAEAQK